VELTAVLGVHEIRAVAVLLLAAVDAGAEDRLIAETEDPSPLDVERRRATTSLQQRRKVYTQILQARREQTIESTRRTLNLYCEALKCFDNNKVASQVQEGHKTRNKSGE